jgi:hypothetical protein
MIRSPFVALLVTFGFFLLVFVALSALFVALADSDAEAGDGCTDPETGEAREVENSDALADSFDESLSEAQEAVRSGQGSAEATFSEGEVSSRAAAYLEARDVPLEDLVICFHDGSAEASATIEVPRLHGIPIVGEEVFTMYASATGTINFEGERPSLQIDEVDAGHMPDFVEDEIASQVEDEINDHIDDLVLEFNYEVTFTEGQATLTVSPR